MDNGSGYYDYCSITCRDSQHCLASGIPIFCPCCGGYCSISHIFTILHIAASAPNLSYMHAKQAIQQQGQYKCRSSNVNL